MSLSRRRFWGIFEPTALSHKREKCNNSAPAKFNFLLWVSVMRTTLQRRVWSQLITPNSLCLLVESYETINHYHYQLNISPWVKLDATMSTNKKTINCLDIQMCLNDQQKSLCKLIANFFEYLCLCLCRSFHTSSIGTYIKTLRSGVNLSISLWRKWQPFSGKALNA